MACAVVNDFCEGPVSPRDISPPVMTLKERLRDSFRELAVVRGPENVGVEQFCRHFANVQGRRKKHRGDPSCSKDQAEFLTAFLETFRLESREGRSFLALVPLAENPRLNAPVPARNFQAGRQSSDRELLRRMTNRRLLDNQYFKIRVTNRFWENGLINFMFVLKKSEDNLYHLQVRLNEADLGGPIPCFPGRVCAAPYPEPEPDPEDDFPDFYARAVVVKHQKKNTEDTLVRFLDFGAKEYVKKTTLRKLSAEFLQTPVFAYRAVVMNHLINRTYLPTQLVNEMILDETLIRILRYDEDRKIYEVYVYSPADGPEYNDAGFLAG